MRRPSSERVVRLVAVILATVIVGWSTLGAGVAGGQGAESYAVRQGDRCVDVTPLSGNESVLEFYGYQSTIEDNPYTTEIGPGFSSEGTLDLQVAETSLLFLYADPGGNLSLVVIHGAREEGVDGGSASFDLSGLPADGWWAVKDDEYDSPENLDNWSHGETTATVDWTWSRSATDGGAFSGLGEDFDVTVEPAFNGGAELFGQANFGVVENWTLLSGDRANPNRTPLDRSENVTISTGPCDGTDAASPGGEGNATTEATDGEADRAGADGDDRNGNQGRGNGGGPPEGVPFGDDEGDDDDDVEEQEEEDGNEGNEEDEDDEGHEDDEEDGDEGNEEDGEDGDEGEEDDDD